MGETPGGSVVLSVDAELGWGFHDFTTPPEKRLAAARDGWRQLQQLSVEYDVPMTWAVVGHLFLDGCDRRHAVHPTPPDWFECERGKWRNRPGLRFGGDLITDLLESEVEHEIGCHTFSHVVFDDEMVDREVIEAELTAAIEAASEYGIEYDSFVFPRNAVGYRDVLAAYGLKAYRSKQPEPPKFRRQFDKLRTVVNPKRVELAEPVVDEYGLVDIPPSLYAFGFQGPVRRLLDSVWVDPIVRQATAGIDQAVRTDGVFHLWLHPNDLVTGRDVKRVEAIFEYIDQCRKHGLTVETMANIADRMGAREGSRESAATKRTTPEPQ